jgi:hypothetical protein
MSKGRDHFRGTHSGGCTIYLADGNPPHTEVQTGTYELNLTRDVQKDLAGPHFARTGSRLKSLPKRAIAHDVVILIRPTTTKAEALSALKAIMASIKKEGLVLGGTTDIWRDVGGEITI